MDASLDDYVKMQKKHARAAKVKKTEEMSEKKPAGTKKVDALISQSLDDIIASDKKTKGGTKTKGKGKGKGKGKATMGERQNMQQPRQGKARGKGFQNNRGNFKNFSNGDPAWDYTNNGGQPINNNGNRQPVKKVIKSLKPRVPGAMPRKVLMKPKLAQRPQQRMPFQRMKQQQPQQQPNPYFAPLVKFKLSGGQNNNRGYAQQGQPRDMNQQYQDMNQNFIPQQQMIQQQPQGFYVNDQQNNFVQQQPNQVQFTNAQGFPQQRMDNQNQMYAPTHPQQSPMGRTTVINNPGYPQQGAIPSGYPIEKQDYRARSRSPPARVQKGTYGRRIQVTNIPSNLAPKDLEEAFLEVGQVEKVEVGDGGKAWVVFSSSKEAYEAEHRYDGGQINHQIIRVSVV